MKFSIKDFFSKCDQIGSFLRIWSDLLKKSLMENFIFCEVNAWYKFNLGRVSTGLVEFIKIDVLRDREIFHWRCQKTTFFVHLVSKYHIYCLGFRFI